MAKKIRSKLKLSKTVNTDLGELSKYSVGTTQNGNLLIVEAEEFFNFFDNGWKCQTLRDLGQELKIFKLSDNKVESKVADKVTKKIKIGPVQYTKGVYHREQCNFCIVKKDKDFDSLYEKLAKKMPIVMFPKKGSHGLFISFLQTERDGMIFEWARKSVKSIKSGRKEYKLILVSVNSILPSELNLDIRQSILDLIGLMAQPVFCEIGPEKAVQNVACYK